LALDAAKNVVWQTSPPEFPKPSSELVPSGVVSVSLSQAIADHSQEMFPAANAIKNP